MEKMKKLTVLVLACVLALATISVCAEEMYPVNEPVELIFLRQTDSDLFSAGFSTYNDAPGFKAWQEATGIQVTMLEVADEAALRLQLASGTLPDIVLGSKDFYTGGQVNMEADGIAIELTEEMLSRYAPDYWALLNSNDAYMQNIRAINGKIYAVAGYCWQEGSPYRSWRGMVYREEYLKQLELEAPETAEELYTVLYRMKNELGVETPLVAKKDNFFAMLYDGAITSPFGLVSDSWYQKDGVIHFGAAEPEYKEVLAYVNKLYTEGLISVDFASMDEATAQAGVVNGTSGAIYAAVSRINNLMKSANSADFTLIGGPALQCADGSRSMFGQADPYVSGSFWCYITEDCKNPEAALMFLNYLFTEKGNMLFNFGTEGLTYEMVNGEPVFTEFVTQNPDGYALDPMLRAYGCLNFAGVQDRRMSQQRFPLSQQRDAISLWADTDVDKYTIVTGDILMEYNDEYTSLWTDLKTFVEENRAKFISGARSLDEFDQYLAELDEMGMQQILEIRQISLDAYKE